MAGYDTTVLASALVAKGGYNQTDANNAASNKGGNADQLAKEFLGYSGTSSDLSTIPSSSDQLPTYLADFQKTAMDSLSSLKAPDTPTFDELKNNLTPSTLAPTPIDRNQLTDTLRTTYGVTDLETQLNSLKTDQQKAYDDLRALTGTEEGKPVAMNVISGRVTEEQRVAQQRLDVITRQKDSVTNELTTKYNVINTYVTNAGLDYNDAVTAYNADFDRNYKIQSMVTDMSNNAFNQNLSVLKTGIDTTLSVLQQQQAIKQSNIDNARANLTTMANAITSGNTTYDAMSSDQKLQIQKLEIQSGLPVGTIASMGVSAKDKILAFSSDNTQAWVVGSDGKMNIISTGLTKTPTQTDKTEAAKSDVINKVKAAASHGVTLNELISMYSGTSGVTATDVYEAYNQTSSWGPATETADQLAKLGVKTINNTSSTTSY